MNIDQVLPHLAKWIQEVTGHEPQISEGEYDEDDLKMMVVLTTLRPEILLDAVKAIHPSFDYPVHVTDPCAVLLSSLESFFDRDRHALGLSTFGIDDEVDGVNDDYCVESDQDSQNRQCVRLLLGCAVQGPNKAEHVQVIMRQSPDTQRVLMLEIEAVMETLAASAFGTTTTTNSHDLIIPGEQQDTQQQDQLDVNNTDVSTATDPADATGEEAVSCITPRNEADENDVFSPNVGDEVPLEMDTEEGAEDGAEIEDLKVKAKRLERVNRAVKQENSEIEDELARTKAEVLQLEEQLGSAKDALEQHEKQQQAPKNTMSLESHAAVDEAHQVLLDENSEQQRQIIDLLEQTKTGQRAKAELAALRDEVDLLQVDAGKARKLQIALDRTKSKLEDTAAMRSQVQQLQNKNKELVQGNLELEEKLRNSQSQCRELDALQRTHTQLQASMLEYKALLRDRDEEVSGLVDRCTSLEQNEVVAAREHASLQQDLQGLDSSLGGNSGQTAGVGVGMTELNPQVQEEITRLRRENKRLLQEVDSVSDDSVRELRYNLANEERLRSHFEGEFRDVTKAGIELRECLDRTQTRVEALTVELADEREVVAQLRSDVSQLRQVESELRSALEQSETKVAELLAVEIALSERRDELELQIEQVKKAAADADAAWQERVAEMQMEAEKAAEQAADRLESVSNDASERLVDAENSYRLSLEEQVERVESEVKQDAEKRVMLAQQQQQERDEEACAQVEAIQESLDKSQSAVQALECKLTEISKKLESSEEKTVVTETEVERLRGVINVGRTRFNELTEAETKVRMEADTISEELSRCRNRLANAEIKLAQARKQCQTLQMQNGGGDGNQDSGGAGGGGGLHANELGEEVERLSSELQSMTEKCEQLRAQIVQVGGCSDGMTPGGPYVENQVTAGGRNLRQVIRTYEVRVQELEREKNSQSLARTSEITRRVESDKKAMQFMDALEETKAQLVSAQLESERWRKQARGVVEAMASSAACNVGMSSCDIAHDRSSKENLMFNALSDEVEEDDEDDVEEVESEAFSKGFGGASILDEYAVGDGDNLDVISEDNSNSQCQQQ